jgi:hypothetical protein
LQPSIALGELSWAEAIMGSKEEKERLAKELQDAARPLFAAIGLDEKVIE